METILDRYNNYLNCSFKSHFTHGICGTVSWEQVTDNRTPSLFGGRILILLVEHTTTEFKLRPSPVLFNVFLVPFFSQVTYYTVQNIFVGIGYQ